MPTTHSTGVPVPPTACEPTVVVIVSAPATTDATAPSVPVADTGWIACLPTVKPTNLGLPPVIDGVNPVVVNICPSRAVVDIRIANVDLANVDRISIGTRSTLDTGW